MTRHGCNDEKFFFVLAIDRFGTILAKVQELAEGHPESGDFSDTHQVVAGDRVRDAEERLAVAPGTALEHFKRGREGAVPSGSRQGDWPGSSEAQASIRRGAPGRHRRMIHLIEIIEHIR